MKKQLVLLILWSFFLGAPGAAAGASLPAMPACDDAKLLSQVKDKIASVYKNHTVDNILERRQRALTLRNLDWFGELDIAEYTQPNRRPIANKIVTLKITDGVADSDLRLCRTRSVASLPEIYLLIHPQNGLYLVDILNFALPGQGKADYFLIYN